KRAHLLAAPRAIARGAQTSGDACLVHVEAAAVRRRALPSDASLSAQGGEALTATKILRVLSRGRDATVRVPGNAWVPIDDGLAAPVCSRPRHRPCTPPAYHGGCPCAAGDPTGHGPIEGIMRVFSLRTPPSARRVYQPAALPERGAVVDPGRLL